MHNIRMLMLAALCFHIRLTFSTTTETVESVDSITPAPLIAAQSRMSQSPVNETKDNRRTARQMNLDRVEYVIRTNDNKGKPAKRQLIRINGNVAKINVLPKKIQSATAVYPVRQPHSASSNRIKHTLKNAPKKGRLGPLKPTKRPIYDYEYEYDEPKPKRAKKSKKPKYVIKDVSPQEYYEEYDEFQNLATNPATFVQKLITKRPRKRPEYESVSPVTSFTHISNYGDEEDDERKIRRPTRQHYDYDEDYEVFSESKTQPLNYGLNVVEAPVLKPKTVKKSKPEIVENTKNYGGKDLRGYGNVRQMHSLFPQSYTSHNPFVTTNINSYETDDKPKTWSQYYESDSLDSQRENRLSSDFSHTDVYSKQSVMPFEFGAGVGGTNDYQTAASHIHQETTLPVSGLQVVQPPQFKGTEHSMNELSRYKEVPVNPSGSSVYPSSQGSSSSSAHQKATLKDILQQDCPGSEISGYCSSPPRYPTQQITSAIKRCAEIMEALYSSAPPEPEDDYSSFSRRSDTDVKDYIDEDDVYVNNITGSHSNGVPADRQMWSWARSDNYGESQATACGSELNIIEPGYGKEVLSGRWFVIVQTLESISQKVTVDTCQRPGKTCAGLTNMKCSRSAGFKNGVKSSRCIQRYTHHRLISWDPESPTKCPKIRIFKFPTACVCHLGLL